MNINWKVLLTLGVMILVIVVSKNLIVSAVVVLGGLYFISMITEHQWLKKLRGIDTTQTEESQPIVGVDATGHSLRSHNYHKDRK